MERKRVFFSATNTKTFRNNTRLSHLKRNQQKRGPHQRPLYDAESQRQGLPPAGQQKKDNRAQQGRVSIAEEHSTWEYSGEKLLLFQRFFVVLPLPQSVLRRNTVHRLVFRRKIAFFSASFCCFASAAVSRLRRNTVVAFRSKFAFFNRHTYQITVHFQLGKGKEVEPRQKDGVGVESYMPDGLFSPLTHSFVWTQM